MSWCSTWGLPDVDGVDVIHGLHAWSSAPILALSARRETSDKVRTLDAGAVDHLAEPFAMDELLARLRAAARRPPHLPVDPVVNTARRAAAAAGPDGRQARAVRQWLLSWPASWPCIRLLCSFIPTIVTVLPRRSYRVVMASSAATDEASQTCARAMSMTTLPGSRA